ncbi:unnamed protein product [Ostreobium quekettii]|uniref:NADH:ubiquinone reductase (non-electrogenic) n=1 Tax=Ostreobium quekettii TaxID=121088 RepID=A0A8S1INM0_9CHLO|nr:unnamed protein product [Ostreobium quekettii]
MPLAFGRQTGGVRDLKTPPSGFPLFPPSGGRVISLRNHMVFTPLLASTTVGTLDPRSVTVHVTQIQRALYLPQNQFYVADATSLDPEARLVHCRSEDGKSFQIKYDRLAVCTGSQGSTFGVPGVERHAHFLRDVKQATEIRSHLIKNIARAGIPGTTTEEWNRLLHVVIVGGGPTGVEFAGELCDFVKEDLSRVYPNRAKSVRVTLIEARELLGSFDASLREYAVRRLAKQGVKLMKGVVSEVTPQTLKLKDGDVLSYGLCVWSTGVGPTPFVSAMPFVKTSQGRLAVDDRLRVMVPPKGTALPDVDVVSMTADETLHIAGSEEELEPVDGVYGLGDCSANPANPLPALAQVAEQQGKYLARCLNAQAKSGTSPEPFQYRHLGSMATVGGTSAVLEISSPVRYSMRGFSSWLAWRSAYLTRLGSIRNRLYVAFNWTITLLLGRDLSRW